MCIHARMLRVHLCVSACVYVGVCCANVCVCVHVCLYIYVSAHVYASVHVCLIIRLQLHVVFVFDEVNIPLSRIRSLYGRCPCVGISSDGCMFDFQYVYC